MQGYGAASPIWSFSTHCIKSQIRIFYVFFSYVIIYMNDFKVVCTGDGAVGKTCMLISYAQNKFYADYIPTVFDNYVVYIKVDNETSKLQLWDTAGQEDYARLRCLSYPGTDCFLLCFSVISETSFKNVKSWCDELRHFNPTTPILLVGTKVDLRTDPEFLKMAQEKGRHIRLITTEEGSKMATEVKACGYVECSSRTGGGVKEVFDTAVRTIITHRKPVKVKRKVCHIL